jgi:hypothetical protein
VKQTDKPLHVKPAHLTEDRCAEADGEKSFTPGQFFQEMGAVFASCLGLALLANVLVAFLGAQ